MERALYIETYGCRVNQCESQAIVEGWQRAGWRLTSCPQEASHIIVNSCAITGRAERNARNALNRLRKMAPQAILILTGCAAQFYLDFIPRKKAPWTEPDICIPQAEKSRLLSGPDLLSPRELFPLTHCSQRARPVVKIQDGCSQGCAYCIVPQTRGRPRSLMPEAILQQCRQLALEGFGELLISGINLRQYAGNLWQMLVWLEERLLAEFPSGLRLRLSSLDPALLTAEAVAVLGQSRLLCPHLHLSLQHGSPAILAAMGRKHYDLDQVGECLGQLAKQWPLMGLGSDFILGFPGETEADVAILLDYIRKLPLTYAHVFPFSRRQGTRAWDMPGQVAKSIKEDRARIVRAAVAEKRQRFLERQLSLPLAHMAVELREGSYWRGVNEFYSPCVMAREATDASAGKSGESLLCGRPTGIQNGTLVLEKIRISG